MEGKNIIQKLSVDLHYSGNDDSFRLQRELSDWCSLKLAPALEEALDKNSGSKKYIRIEELVLEIDTGINDNWMKILPMEIAGLLNRKLDEINSGKKQDEIFSVHTSEEIFYETLIFFLKNGNLPWWSDIRNREQFSNHYSLWINAGIGETQKKELIGLMADYFVQERIVDQFSTNDFFLLVRQMSADITSELEKLRSDIIQLTQQIPTEKKATAEKKIKRTLLAGLLMGKEIKTLPALAKEMITIITSCLDVITIKQNSFESSILRKVFEQVAEQTVKESEISPDVPDKKGKHIKDGQEIYISNAGLVIIAPFLPIFFKKLNLIQDDIIVDKDIAACLVNFLAGGNEEMAEFELGLARILCGLDMKTPVSTMIRFTDEQKNEAKDLLRSVIEYWNILKDTSVEGLRQSFLLREGKLSFSKSEWLLQVESKGYDVLLHHLPWNIGMIRLPWMKFLLKTEWIA